MTVLDDTAVQSCTGSWLCVDACPHNDVDIPKGVIALQNAVGLMQNQIVNQTVGDQ